VVEAQALLNKFQQAIEKTPPDTATANNTLILLATVQGLPSGVAPLIAELNDAAVQASPVTVAGIMAQINAAFATATNTGILGGLLSKL
jgi:hypothetical protein